MSRRPSVGLRDLLAPPKGALRLLLWSFAGCMPAIQPAPIVEPRPMEQNAPRGLIAAEGNAGSELSPPSAADAADAAVAVEPSVGVQQPVADAEDDQAFVQSREARGPTPEEVRALPIHLNESWWPFRARQLRMTVAETKRRDAAISRSQAPSDFWDEQTAVEAVSVWTVLCNECHGGRRNVEDALKTPTPAPAWGQGEGLFFGNRRAYQHVFDIVYNGGPNQNGARSEMIAWKKELSREQIWALLYFLEYQSGGIEGRFPPSLYPRRSEAVDLK